MIETESTWLIEAGSAVRAFADACLQSEPDPFAVTRTALNFRFAEDDLRGHCPEAARPGVSMLLESARKIVAGYPPDERDRWQIRLNLSALAVLWPELASSETPAAASLDRGSSWVPDKYEVLILRTVRDAKVRMTREEIIKAINRSSGIRLDPKTLRPRFKNLLTHGCLSEEQGQRGLSVTARGLVAIPPDSP